MWNYEDFLAKAKIYFDRAARHDDVDDEFSLWLLLGLEFLLRAPLAKVHPSLLASPEGDSILHAVGVLKAASKPRSVPTRTVVGRLKYVISEFGEDREQDAVYLADLRNAELHSADPVLRNLTDDVWLPRFLAVVEPVCAHLEVPIEGLVDKDILKQARALQVKVDKALERRVQDLISKSRYFFDHLTPDEVEARESVFMLSNPSPNREKDVACPACGSTGNLLIAPGRTTRSKYRERGNDIIYSVVYTAKSFECRVCGLSLADTAMVTAAGIDRVHIETFSEDRYEGWEESVSEDAIKDAALQYMLGDDCGDS